MSKAQSAAFPSFAPLPSSLVYRFVEERDKYDFLAPSTATSGEQAVLALPYFQVERAHLARRVQGIPRADLTGESTGDLTASLLYLVQQKRSATYTLMNPAASALSTEWLLRTLADTGHTVTPTTLSRWRDAGLLRYDKRDRPDTDSVGS